MESVRDVLSDAGGYLARELEPRLPYELAETASFGNQTALVETSILPLSKTYTSLANHQFPKGGGALAVAESKILILDRLGSIYLFADQEVRKLNFAVPNNLKGYITGYEKAPSLSANSFSDIPIGIDDSTYFSKEPVLW